MDNFNWNIYIDINAMSNMDKEFYTKYYKYKIFINKKSKEVDIKKYKSTDEYKRLIDSLNYSYCKIKNVMNEDKNEFGEYEYPTVGYKTSSIDGVKHVYACIADTSMNKKIGIGDVLLYIPLLMVGDVKATKTTSSGLDSVVVTTTVDNLVKAFRLYVLPNKEHRLPLCDVSKCNDLLMSFTDYPTSSIVEADFKGLLSIDDLNSLIKEFKDNFNEKKEAI